MGKTEVAKIQFRRGTASAWTSANPILLNGEPGYETDTKKYKIGDGVTVWASLAYVTSGGGGGGSQNVFIQQTQPTLDQNLLWVELNNDNSIKTFWINTL